MPLNVEDGTGKPNADSYVSISFADGYHQDVGNTGWDGTNVEKESYLRLGTQWIEGKYRDKFPGTKATKAQGLYFPVKSGVDADGFDIDEDEIPLVLQQATAEAALLAKNGNLPKQLERGGRVKREKVDVIEVEYMDGAPAQARFVHIEHLLSRLFTIKPTRLLRI